jgi:excisionase family DNA binding protein
MAQQLITVEEAGRAIGVSRSTIWRLIKRGETS